MGLDLGRGGDFSLVSGSSLCMAEALLMVSLAAFGALLMSDCGHCDLCVSRSYKRHATPLLATAFALCTGRHEAQRKRFVDALLAFSHFPKADTQGRHKQQQGA